MSHLEDLKKLYKVSWDSINETPPEKRGPLINQCRVMLAEIAELEADIPSETENPLEKLKREREERRAAG